MLLLFPVDWKSLHKQHVSLLLLWLLSLLYSHILWECPSLRYSLGRSPHAVWLCPRGQRRPLPDTDPHALCFGKTGMSAWQRCCWLPLFPSRHKEDTKKVKRQRREWKPKLTRSRLFKRNVASLSPSISISIYGPWFGSKLNVLRSEWSDWTIQL